MWRVFRWVGEWGRGDGTSKRKAQLVCLFYKPFWTSGPLLGAIGGSSLVGGGGGDYNAHSTTPLHTSPESDETVGL